MRRIGLIFGLVAIVVGRGSLALGQDEPRTKAPDAKAKEEPKAESHNKPKRLRRGGPLVYMGREVADVMSFHGADWLVRDTREAEEQPEQMLDSLKLKPGDVVADVGAGVGYTSLKIARRVGAKGKVYATDVQPQMLRMLAANAKDAGFSNVKGVLCTPTDQKLPAGEVDLAIMVDVYHECSDPEATLRSIRKALKPKGRLVLIEFRGEDPEVPIKPEHKMTFAQVKKEIEPQGFTFKEKFDFLPWQHIIIFEKKEEQKETNRKDAKSAEKTGEDSKN